jgi:hypothetical protein
MDPDAFAGREQFSPPDGLYWGRLPVQYAGQGAAWCACWEQSNANIRRAQKDGIALSEATLARLTACASQLKVAPLVAM